MTGNTKNKIVHEIRRDDFHCRRCSNTDSLQCPPHLHSDLELVYLEKGSVVAHADTSTEILKEGDVFLSFPNQTHYYVSLGKQESYMLFIIKPDLFPEYLDVFMKHVPTSPVITGARDLPRVDDLFHMLWESEQEKDVPPVQKVKRRCGYLLALLSELLAHMQLQSNEGEGSNTLQTVIRYCSGHFAENISLASLEKDLHLSRYHLSHLFNTKLGLRFNDYINSLRISEACRLLLNTQKSITQISESVGFNSPRTFNRAFIRQIGLSPSEYRKMGASPTRINRFTRLPAGESLSASASPKQP